jgi:hypothetical protein
MSRKEMQNIVRPQPPYRIDRKAAKLTAVMRLRQLREKAVVALLSDQGRFAVWHALCDYSIKEQIEFMKSEK